MTWYEVKGPPPQPPPPAAVLQRDCRGAKEGRRRPLRVETMVVRER